MNVLKIGGGAGIDHRPVLQNVAERVRRGEQWVVVHGCSDLANQLAAQAGYTVQTITSPNGHTSRYTDSQMIELFSQAASQINQQVCDTLREQGLQSMGLVGEVYGQRKTAIRAIRNGRQIIIRDDYSGTISGVNQVYIMRLLHAGITPVIAPLAVGLEGEALNVDGDLVAATIARELEADTLLILSNVPGLLRDVRQPDSLITEFSLAEIERYETFAAGRMKKKLLAARQAQVGRVILSDARVQNPVDMALDGHGTHILSSELRVLSAEAR